MHLHNVPTEDQVKGSTPGPGVYEVELTERDKGQHNAGVLIDQVTDTGKIRAGKVLAMERLWRDLQASLPWL
jgi:hypothetical protein